MTIVCFILNEKHEISFIAIQESSICEAFYSFFHSLNTTDYSLAKEEQRLIISNEIRKLETAVSQNRFAPQTIQKVDFQA